VERYINRLCIKLSQAAKPVEIDHFHMKLYSPSRHTGDGVTEKVDEADDTEPITHDQTIAMRSGEPPTMLYLPRHVY
jgi:hypothetical protein